MSCGICYFVFRLARLRESQTKSTESVLCDDQRRLRAIFTDGAHGAEMLSRQDAAVRTRTIRQGNVQEQFVEHVKRDRMFVK